MVDNLIKFRGVILFTIVLVIMMNLMTARIKEINNSNIYNTNTVIAYEN